MFFYLFFFLNFVYLYNEAFIIALFFFIFDAGFFFFLFLLFIFLFSLLSIFLESSDSVTDLPNPLFFTEFGKFVMPYQMMLGN